MDPLVRDPSRLPLSHSYKYPQKAKYCQQRYWKFHRGYPMEERELRSGAKQWGRNLTGDPVG